MKTTNLLTLAITLTVGIILAGSLLAPVVTQYSSDGEHTLDVVLISGQSNAQYNSNYADLEEVDATFGAPGGDCYYYGYNTTTLVRPPSNIGDMDPARMPNLLFSPMYDNGWRIGCNEPGIAYYLSNKTHNDVYIINVAIGGQAISYFEPDNEGGSYATALIPNAISKIPSKYTNINYVGWMWCQGESDDDTTIDSYIASFENLQDFYGGYGFKTCYLVQTRSDASGNAYDAQAQIATTVPNVIMASTAPESFSVADGTLQSDGLHYTQEGRDIVSTDVGRAMAENQPTNIREFSYGPILAIVPMLVIIALLVATTAAIFTKRND